MGRILESFLVHGEDVRNVVKGGGGVLRSATCFRGDVPKNFLRFREIRFHKVFKGEGMRESLWGKSFWDVMGES